MKTYLVTYKHRRREQTMRVAGLNREHALASFKRDNPDVFVVGIRLA